MHESGGSRDHTVAEKATGSGGDSPPSPALATQENQKKRRSGFRGGERSGKMAKFRQRMGDC